MRDYRLRQPIWIVPLVIAALVAVFGWWGNARLRQTVEGQLKAELAATLDANVTALDLWTTNQAKLATSLADESGVRALALRILDKFDQAEANNQKVPDLPELEELANYLKPRLKKVGYETAHLVSTNLYVVANAIGGRSQPGFAVHEDHTEKFSELFASGQPVIITPFKPKPEDEPASLHSAGLPIVPLHPALARPTSSRAKIALPRRRWPASGVAMSPSCKWRRPSATITGSCVARWH